MPAKWWCVLCASHQKAPGVSLSIFGGVNCDRLVKVMSTRFLHCNMSYPEARAKCYPRVKWLEIHSLWTKTPGENNRTVKRGGGTLPRPHISHSRSQKTSLTTYVQKGSLKVQRGVTFCLQSFPALSTCTILFFLPDKDFTYFPAAAAVAKSLQSCPALCDPRDSSPWQEHFLSLREFSSEKLKGQGPAHCPLV